MVSNKRAPENQDLLRALLILDRETAAELAHTYTAIPSGINMVSVLHQDMEYLGKELQESFKEFSYYSGKIAIHTNNLNGWGCQQLSALWAELLSSAQTQVSYGAVSNPVEREKNGNLAAVNKRILAIRGHAEECYPVLIKQELELPGQKAFGDLLVTFFDAMQPGKTRQFLVMSINHCMSLMLQKMRIGGSDWLLAFLYDANFTNVHKIALTTSREIVRQEWSLTALLRDENTSSNYWPSGSRHVMVAEVKSWTALDNPGAIAKGRNAHSLAYTNAPTSRDVLVLLSKFSLDGTFRAQLQSLDLEARLARLSEQDSNGTTALYMACQHGHTEIIELICSLLPSEQFLELLQVSDKNGATALLLACQLGHEKIVRMILDSLSPDELRTLLTHECQGWTPLALAKAKGHQSIVTAIEDYGKKHSAIGALLTQEWRPQPLLPDEAASRLPAK